MATGLALLPSRLAWMISPLSKLAQYTWLASTATPTGWTWPVAMGFGLPPSRGARQIVPLS